VNADSAAPATSFCIKLLRRMFVYLPLISNKSARVLSRECASGRRVPLLTQ
jgi:hypothetical protein